MGTRKFINIEFTSGKSEQIGPIVPAIWLLKFSCKGRFSWFDLVMSWNVSSGAQRCSWPLHVLKLIDFPSYFAESLYIRTVVFYLAFLLTSQINFQIRLRPSRSPKFSEEIWWSIHMVNLAPAFLWCKYLNKKNFKDSLTPWTGKQLLFGQMWAIRLLFIEIKQICLLYFLHSRCCLDRCMR